MGHVYTICVRAYFRGSYVDFENGYTIAVEYHYMSPWGIDKVQMVYHKVVTTNETQCLSIKNHLC